MGRRRGATLKRDRREKIVTWSRVCRERAAQLGGWKCEKCGKKLSKSTALGHHRWPVVAGGPRIVSNCQLRCRDCEYGDYHWIAKNAILVINYLLSGSFGKLKKEATAQDQNAFVDLPHELSFFASLIALAIKRQKAIRKHGPHITISSYDWMRRERALN